MTRLYYESLQSILIQRALINVSDALPDFFHVGMAKIITKVNESHDLTSILGLHCHAM